MGKSKSSKRFGTHRQNPTVPLNIQLSEEIPDAEAVPSVIATIVEQLNNPAKEERTCGCIHMARIVSQPKAVEMLLQQDVVKIIAPLFLDDCVDVQKCALGAMRNMSIYGEEVVCEAMVKNDIITPLSAVIKKFAENYESGQDKVKRDTVTSILLEATELLSNLCEYNDRALQIFNKEGILSMLLQLMNPESCGYPLSVAVAHCLHIVSEKNTEVSRVCGETEAFSRLMNAVTSSPSSIDAVLFRTRVIGIILNLSDVDLSKYYDCFIKIAGEVLDMDYLPLITLAVEGIEQTEEKGKGDDDLSQEDIDKLVAAQRVCLEMLANLCCTDEEWEEMDDDDSNGEMEDGGDTAVSQQEEIVDSLCLSSEIHTAFLKHNLLAKVMKKAHPLDQAQVTQLESSHLGKAILQRLEDLQSRALLCLSNVISAVYDSSEPAPTPIASMWSELYSLAKTYQGKNEDYIWALTSGMRSVLQKMAETDEDQIKTVTPTDLDFLVKLGAASSNAETQINTIRMVSTIGCVLAVNVEQHSLVKTIGELLLQVCRSNDNVVVVSETLDSIFDVFKEDETDPVAKEISLVQHLKSIQPAFKSKVSKERKNLGDHFGIVMMARDNLNPFLKYKMARRL